MIRTISVLWGTYTFLDLVLDFFPVDYMITLVPQSFSLFQFERRLAKLFGKPIKFVHFFNEGATHARASIGCRKALRWRNSEYMDMTWKLWFWLWGSWAFLTASLILFFYASCFFIIFFNFHIFNSITNFLSSFFAFFICWFCRQLALTFTNQAFVFPFGHPNTHTHSNTLVMGCVNAASQWQASIWTNLTFYTH